MKRFFYISTLILVLCFSVSCVNESYFGESKEANIVTFAIQGEMSNRIDPMVDWQDVGQVYITVPSSADLHKLKVTDVVCSQLAYFTSDPYLLTDFSEPVALEIVAEKQSIRKKWMINVTKQEVENTQLPFSNFTEWTPAKNHLGVPITLKEYIGYFPGNGKDYSPWQSSIAGNALALSGISELSVIPNTMAAAAQYARLITVTTKSGALMGAGVAAGGLFTGQFILNTDYVIAEKSPRKMINNGVPFYSKPTAVKLDIRYKAGAQIMDGKLKPIQPGPGKPTQDSCDVMFALQNRSVDPTGWVRVATASLRAPAIGTVDDTENGFVTVTLPFVYGAPTEADLAAKPYQKIGGSQGELFFYTFVKSGDKWDVSANPVKEVYAADPQAASVDHIAVMFSCSTYGDLFYAAPGSTLDVKNVTLIYE